MEETTVNSSKERSDGWVQKKKGTMTQPIAPQMRVEEKIDAPTNDCVFALFLSFIWRCLYKSARFEREVPVQETAVILLLKRRLVPSSGSVS